MANTYTLISSNTLGSAAASVTFSSIPGTYDDLAIRLSARTDIASTSEGIRLQFNGDTATNYSAISLTGNGSTPTVFGFSSQTSASFVRSLNGDSATANTFGSWEAYIAQYANSSTNPISTFGAGETNAAGIFMGIGAGLYRNGSGISSITILNSNSVNFMSGSSFYLYGISNS
jgi:hypothetical protein